jgi:hypothetical protein
VTIQRLKIVNCADDDEDMYIGLSIWAFINSAWHKVFAKSYPDVYVEEEGKVGNDSRCVFFGGEQVQNIANAAAIAVSPTLQTLDGDGLRWGGTHHHAKLTSALSQGANAFTEGKQHSDQPGTQGDYELRYTITVQ